MDWLSEGIKATVIGMGITFAILIIISFVISLFVFIKPAGSKKKDEKNPPKVSEVKSEEPVVQSQSVAIAQPAATAQVNDTELVAVITAAIAASMNTSVDKLIVTSFKRINNRAV